MVNRKEQVREWMLIGLLILFSPAKFFRPKFWRDFRTTLFVGAAWVGDKNALRFLMWLGAKVEDRESIGESTALMSAASKGHNNIAEWLLAAGADINAESRGNSTALMRAAENGHESTVRFLLAAGADLEKQNMLGFPAVTFAAINGHVAVLKILVDAGANINACGGRHKITALKRARQFRQPESVSWLQQYGALE